MIKRLMETPNARGIIIFANEDDIRWARGRVLLQLFLKTLLPCLLYPSHVHLPFPSFFPSYLPATAYLFYCSLCIWWPQK